MEEAKKLDAAKLDDLMDFAERILDVLEGVQDWALPMDEHTREFVAGLFVGIAGELACLSSAILGDRAALEGVMAGLDRSKFDRRISLFGLCTVIAVDKKLRAGLREEEPCC